MLGSRIRTQLDRTLGQFHSMKNLSIKRSIYVVGNGPSLRGFDFHSLRGKDSIGMNVAFRHWHRINWYPTYYTCLDTVMSKVQGPAIRDLILNHGQHFKGFFLRKNILHDFPELNEYPHVLFLEDYRDEPMFEGMWEWITTGSFAVLYAAMLGYRKIELLGIDLNQVQIIPEARPYEGHVLEIVETPNHNPNYFFDDYQRKGERYNIPDATPGFHLNSWKAVIDRLKKYRVELVNHSEKSKLVSLCVEEKVKRSLPILEKKASFTSENLALDQVSGPRQPLPDRRRLDITIGNNLSPGQMLAVSSRLQQTSIQDVSWTNELDSELISVILSVYNGEKYLDEAIQSVESQTLSNYELILIDDGSTDGSWPIIDAAAKENKKIRAIRLETNSGQAAGFNIGIMVARGMWTCFMDADDVLFSRKLELLKPICQGASSDVSFVQHNLEILRGNTLTGVSFRPVIYSGDVLNHSCQQAHYIPGPFIPTSGLTFKTEVLRAIYPIPHTFRICADGFLTRAAVVVGKTLAYDASLGFYRIHSNNNTIENDEFNSRAYVDDILIPEINAFYCNHGVDVILPCMKKSTTHINLKRIDKCKSAKGLRYKIVDRDACRNIASLKDKHKGKRGFIVATGPSLRVADLEMLKSEVTFSCNKITLAFDQTDWRPTYYSIIDSIVSASFAYDFESFESVKVFPRDLARAYGHLSRTHFVNNLTPRFSNNKRIFEFSTNLAEGVGGGYTVIYLLMQLAYHVGIQELYLVGLDFSFKYNNLADKVTEKGEKVIINNGESNHFHSDYRNDGEAWTMPRLDLQYQAFKAAKAAFEQDRRKVFNASRNTALDLFEKVAFDSLFMD